ncbi:MAG: glycosyltransferase family 2 protein [Calditrichia bacterium]
MRHQFQEDHLPSVTLIISAYNEEKVIEKKLENSLKISYPRPLFEILVVSDASTDRTDEIVSRYAQRDERVKLLRLENRSGKSVGLNRAAQVARGDILVFSDANALYEENAVRQLVKYFHDSRVGYVVGNARYLSDSDNPASEHESLYWQYETEIKKLESEFYSICVGDGAIYAIRKSLYQPIDEDDIGDFVHPLIILSKNYLGVFNTAAVCHEDAAGDYQKEFYRKRRIVNRSWRAYKKYVGLFNLRDHKKVLFALFSHKVLKWFNWLLLGLLLISNVVLVVLNPSLFYNLFLLLQVIFIGLALIGWLANSFQLKKLQIIYLPYFFWLMHLAAMWGVIDDWRGKRYTTWNHVR